MKALKISLIFTLLLNNVIVSQDTIYIYQKVGGILKIPMNNVDSIIFYDTTSIALDTSITDTSSTITDADGNVYTSVTIGKQEWMVQNLRTTKYADGTVISNVTGNTEWSNLSTGAWSHYNNDSQYEATYGKLYNWYAVETGKLCPTGWHVPTDAEWTVLTDYLAVNGHSGEEGKALKATSGWNDYNGQLGNGTDDYGWLGLPGGSRYNGGYFYSIGDYSYWWSSSEYPTDRAWARNLASYGVNLDRDASTKIDGFSVRCLKD